MLVLKLFNYQIPYTEFIYFLTYFVFMKFTVLTIPGGGIITILPLLASELNFNYENAIYCYDFVFIARSIFSPFKRYW